ncbi:UPF0220-domain-containing protein [Paraphysoderma sedebokerense]|nr:UPF0220-domain-containing protein [Paraphysoderma sedebokerense]
MPSSRSTWLYKDCLCFNWSDVAVYKREIIGYFTGLLFSIGWWIFIDAIVVANAKHLPEPILFEDYVPGIMSTLGLIMINSVDKSLLSANEYSHYGGSGVAWKARLFAFIGIAIAVGSLGGAISILSLKYIAKGLVDQNAWPGVAIVVQNFLIFLSAMMLWLGRNVEDRVEYNIVL